VNDSLPTQSVFVRHSTQTERVESQIGWNGVPAHVFMGEHGTRHWRVNESQRPVYLHSASELQTQSKMV